MSEPGGAARWGRLRQVVDERMKRIGLQQGGLQAVGGPSAAWLQTLAGRSGEPSTRVTPYLRKLDRAMRWGEGQSLKFLTQRNPDLVEDMADRMIDEEDPITGYLAAFEARLRLLDDGQLYDALAKIGEILDLRLTLR